MVSTMTAKQMRSLLQSISADPQMKQSQDSILLAEDQYPENLDAIFTKLSVPSTLQNTMTLLQWNRNSCDSTYDAVLKTTSITNQDYLRKTYQLVPTSDNPWDMNTFRRWKYFVTNLCLSAVQDAMKSTDYGKSMKYLFQPDTKEETKKEQHNTKSNAHGLLLYHPVLLDSPWEAPDDLDDQIAKLLLTTEPILMARAEKQVDDDDARDNRDKDHAAKQVAVLHLSIKNILERVYKITSHSFHVLIKDLIPHARQDNSSLFTHIKGARTDHIVALREHHKKKRDKNLPDLTAKELKTHSAKHTLDFIEDNYVEMDDDAAHYTWGEILTATRLPKVTIFAWVDSFTLLALRYSESGSGKISKGRVTKINKVVAKQITDDEKLIIATLDSNFTAVKVHKGEYVYSELVKLLAQNVTSFTKKYAPHEHTRIMQYLKARAKRQVIMPIFSNPIPKGKGKGRDKRQKLHDNKPRAWTYLQEPATSLISPGPYQSPKGKGKDKGKPKGNGKGKGKPKGKGRGQGDKGKGLFKGKGKSPPKGKTMPGLQPVKTQSSEVNHGHLKCHFCHIIGHIKPNCRKWLALQTSDQYKQRNSHETKYQLIYDHLEDSLLAPRLCQYCDDYSCDGSNCESTFDYEDYNEASLFFTQNLSAVVLNAKLDRPLDSHAPQTDQLYTYEDDNWGDAYEDEYTDQWQESDEQHYEAQEDYTAEVDKEDDNMDDDEEAADSDAGFDEDDQDRYV